MAFKKGYDPNRARGKPARNIDGRKVTEMARDYTAEALEFQVSVMRDPAIEDGVRLRAANMILNRGWGQPGLNLKVEQNHTHEHVVTTINVDALNLADKRSILAAIDAAANAAPVIDAQPLEALPAKATVDPR